MEPGQDPGPANACDATRTRARRTLGWVPERPHRTSETRQPRQTAPDGGASVAMSSATALNTVERSDLHKRSGITDHYLTNLRVWSLHHQHIPFAPRPSGTKHASGTLPTCHRALTLWAYKDAVTCSPFCVNVFLTSRRGKTCAGPMHASENSNTHYRGMGGRDSITHCLEERSPHEIGNH